MAEKVFKVADFAAPGKSDSQAIADCLGERKKTKGPCKVVFDTRDWYIDEAILIPSDTSVIIDGCAIKQNDEVFDNVFRGDNLVIDPQNPWGAPIDVKPARNIRILGRNGAKVVGCDVNRKAYHPFFNEIQEMTGDYWGWRAHQISLSLCSGFEVAGIELSRTRSWAMSLDMCSGGHIHDLVIKSNVKNGDGVDFRAGCHNCRVENIRGYTSDDTVACTALLKFGISYPNGKYLYPCEPTYALVKSGKYTEKDIWLFDIHDIVISDIFTGGLHHGVICLAANGGKVREVRINNVVEDTSGERYSAVKIYTGYLGGYSDDDISDICVENVVSNISKYAVECNAKVKNVTLKNIVQNNPLGEKFSIAVHDGIRIIE